MAGSLIGGGRTATLNLMVGIFLKLLGFFVVLYSYAEINPVKVKQAEQSLAERFNISVALMDEKDVEQEKVTAPVQQSGRAYREITEKLQTQVDFLSTETQADSDTLVLRLPAATALSFEGREAQDPDFAAKLANVLTAQNASGFAYQLQVAAIGSNNIDLMRPLGGFAKQMVDAGYPAPLITIGYQFTVQDPVLELRIKQVARQ